MLFLFTMLYHAASRWWNRDPPGPTSGLELAEATTGPTTIPLALSFASHADILRFRLQADGIRGDRLVGRIVTVVVRKILVIPESIPGTSCRPAHPSHRIAVHIVVVHRAVLYVPIHIVESEPDVLRKDLVPFESRPLEITLLL